MDDINTLTWIGFTVFVLWTNFITYMFGYSKGKSEALMQAIQDFIFIKKQLHIRKFQKEE